MKPLYILLILLVFTACSTDPAQMEPEVMINKMIVPNEGVGDVRFGDDGNKVISEHQAYSHLTAAVTFNDASFVMWYDKGLGFQLDYIDVGNLSLEEIVMMSDDLIDLNQTILQIVVMSPFEGATPEGIKMGSSREDVIVAYGEPDNIGSITEDYDDLNLKVWYNGSNNVRRIDLSN